MKWLNLIKNNFTFKKIFLFNFLILLILFVIDLIVLELTYTQSDDIPLTLSTIIIYYGSGIVAMIFPFLSYFGVLGSFVANNTLLNGLVFFIYSLFIILVLSLIISALVYVSKYFVQYVRSLKFINTK